MPETEKEAVIAGIKENLEALNGRIPGLISLKIQTEKLPSSTADLMLNSLFVDEESLKGYAVHPLHVAAANGAEILVLGAFGCGAFANDPHYVAAAYRDALEEYLEWFSVVEFAVWCKGYETENYKAFEEKMKMYTEA